MIGYPNRMVGGETIAYKILGILLHIAPDRMGQERCVALYKSESGPSEKQDKMMVMALANGYAHGNWPWGQTDK